MEELEEEANRAIEAFLAAVMSAVPACDRMLKRTKRRRT